MKKNMVYFVLYVVLLTELLIVITERDELQEAENQIRDKMITTIAQIYKKPVFISIPEKNSDYDVKAVEPKKVILTPVGLNSEQEKKNIKYFINLEKNSKVPPNWPSNGISSNTNNDNYKIFVENGNGVFNAKILSPGDYKFHVYCQVKRELPDYLPDRLLKLLIEQIGDSNLNQKSKEESFKITAKAIGGLKTKEVKPSF